MIVHDRPFGATEYIEMEPEVIEGTPPAELMTFAPLNIVGRTPQAKRELWVLGGIGALLTLWLLS
jgi:hypothetical protein